MANYFWRAYKTQEIIPDPDPNDDEDELYDEPQRSLGMPFHWKITVDKVKKKYVNRVPIDYFRRFWPFTDHYRKFNRGVRLYDHLPRREKYVFNMKQLLKEYYEEKRATYNIRVPLHHKKPDGGHEIDCTKKVGEIILFDKYEWILGMTHAQAMIVAEMNSAAYYNTNNLLPAHVVRACATHKGPPFPVADPNRIKYIEFKRGVDLYKAQDYVQFSTNMLLWFRDPYQLIFDARHQHPSGHCGYSSFRMPYDRPWHKRKKHHQRHFPLVREAASLVDVACFQKHEIIFIEPTEVAISIMERVMHDWWLSVVIWYTTAYIVLTTYRGVPYLYDFTYILPLMLSIQSDRETHWESREDPATRYHFWTTYVNDPWEHKNLWVQILNLHPPFLRQERMTFMQREDFITRRLVNTRFLKISYVSLMKVFLHRLAHNPFALEKKWAILNKFRPCPNPPIKLVVTRLLKKLDWLKVTTTFVAAAAIWTFCLSSLWKKFARIIDPKLRSRKMLNLICKKAMFGQRRYIRIEEPFYWVYRKNYPRDEIGYRDRWYLSQTFRHTPRSYQNRY